MSVDWKRYRSQFPIFNEWAYFAWASVAPLSKNVVQAMEEQIRVTRDQGVSVYRDWYAAYDSTRQEAAKLISAGPNEIALIKNTSEGVSTVAFGLSLNPGDNVIVPLGEFPSNAYPWLALKENGVEIRRVPIQENGSYRVQDVLPLMDDRTRVVSVSFVNYATGFHAPLADIGDACRKRNILFFVDAIQGLGVIPLDVNDMKIDALAADGHKWICGPEGQGVLFIRKEWQEKISPLSLGWWSVVTPGRYHDQEQALCDSAKRYECGTLTTSTVFGLCAALRILNEVGVDSIRNRISFLSKKMLELLSEIDCQVVASLDERNGSGILSFKFPGQKVTVLAAALERRKILVNARDGMLRIAIHAWNNEADLVRLTQALKEIIKDASS